MDFVIINNKILQMQFHTILFLEAGMWSDMAVALEDLAGVRFLLIPASAASSTTNPSPNSEKPANSILKEYLPQIHGCRDALQVSNPI